MDCSSVAVWGDVATWATAGVTTATAIGAGIAVWFAGRTLRLERERQAQTDEDRRRDQASAIAAWPKALAVAGSSDGFGVGHLMTFQQEALGIGLKGSSPAIAGVVLQNTSQQPVTGFLLHIHTPDGGIHPLVHLARVVPGVVEYSLNHAQRRVLDAFVGASGDSRTWREEYEAQPVSMLFTDNAGQSWQRDTSGRLKAITGDEANELIAAAQAELEATDAPRLSC